jgi:hypothetical protein
MPQYESMPTFDWCLIAREFGEMFVYGKANESESLCVHIVV